MIGIAVKDRVKEISLNDSVTKGMIERLNKTLNLVNQEICYSTCRKKLVINRRKKNGSD